MQVATGRVTTRYSAHLLLANALVRMPWRLLSTESEALLLLLALPAGVAEAFRDGVASDAFVDKLKRLEP